MQIIQNFHGKVAGVVIASIIALSLIGFILMDARQGSSRLFSASTTTLGKVNGEPINTADFNESVKKMQDQYGEQASGSMIYQIRQNVWDQMVSKIVLNDEIKKLGLTFSPKEMSSIMFSQDAPQVLKQAFTDKTTGQYDISKVEQWWSQAKKSKGEQKEAIETEVIEPMQLSTLYGKYNSMIEASAYCPSWLLQKENADSKTFATISYVSVPYNTISDSGIKVSDDEINDYVQKHAAKFKEDEEERMVSYVAFNAAPSKSDTENIVSSLQDLKTTFAADTNAKIFVERNLSSVNYNDVYSPKTKIEAPQKDSITSLPVGGVFGPYIDGKNYVLAKMVDIRQLPDSVKCRHILIGTKDAQGQPTLDDTTAKKRADSIAAAIKGGANFDSLVLKYSDDPGSKDKKGEYTFSLSDFGTLAKEFAETIFYGKTGDKKVIHTEFGWHYIEVLDQKNMEPAYNVAYLAKEILPSEETIDSANSLATKLTGEAQDEKSLEAYVAKNGLKKIDIPVMIKQNDYQLGSLQDARQLIKWAFDAKQGDVSEPFNIGDQFIVAVLDKIQPAGLPDASTARPLVEKTIRDLKKADQINSKLGSSPTLESAASAYNKQIQTAGSDSSLTFSSQIINGIGQEPKLIGASFDKDYQAKASPPVSGTNAVYVFKVNTIGNKPADAPEVAAKQKEQKEKTLQQELYGWFDSLKKLANIKDDRSKVL